MIPSDRILFFPVTPFAADGSVDTGLLAEHVGSRLEWGPGAVFPACGTGEFHTLSASEVRTAVATTVAVADGRLPVVAGAGGPLGHALDCARAASEVGADALLILPPYLVGTTQSGLVSYVEQIVEASDLPVVLYGRGNARYAPETVARLAADPRVIGYKDGLGDIALAQEIVSAVGSARPDFRFFNGLLTAELSQAAYRGIGIPLYSSAAFAMAPEIALSFFSAYQRGDERRRLEILDHFYRPLVALRDQTPGFGVALIKAGVVLGGVPVGGVRAPLSDPDPVQLAELQRIIAIGLEHADAGAGAPVAATR